MSIKVALIDLDGTLADYDEAMVAGLASLMSPEELVIDRQGIGFARDTVPAYLQERERLVRSQPGFYLNLKPLKSGYDVVYLLESMGYQLHVATKSPRHNTAIASKEKIEWCAKNLPNIPVTICGDKSIMGGDLLFDDWPGYLLPWLENNPKGIGLMPDRAWNQNVSHPRLIRVFDNFNSFQLEQTIESYERDVQS